MGIDLKYIDVIVHPVSNGWKVVKEIVYKDLIIPVGFYTNGANIPKILWSLIPPNDPMSFPAVVVHDYLCDALQFEKADDYLEEILISSDVSKWKRISIVSGVRFYTKFVRSILSAF